MTLYAAFSACGGISDYTENLGSGYFFDGEGRGANKITFSKNEQEDSNRMHSIDSISIYPDVIKYSYNEEYILIQQTPDKNGVMAELFEHTTFQKEKLDSFIQNDAYFKAIFSNDTNYWIIEKKNHSINGPYDKKLFMQKKIDLNIPDELVLK